LVQNGRKRRRRGRRRKVKVVMTMKKRRKEKRKTDNMKIAVFSVMVPCIFAVGYVLEETAASIFCPEILHF
jgi:hypothetical protein